MYLPSACWSTSSSCCYPSVICTAACYSPFPCYSCTCQLPAVATCSNRTLADTCAILPAAACCSASMCPFEKQYLDSYILPLPIYCCCPSTPCFAGLWLVLQLMALVLICCSTGPAIALADSARSLLACTVNPRTSTHLGRSVLAACPLGLMAALSPPVALAAALGPEATAAPASC
jgi:hypothetical protein